jgi:hypothetical protein
MSRAAASLAGILALAVVAPRGAPAADEEKKDGASSVLTGRWTYNKELSDDAHAKLRDAMGRQGPGGGRPMGPGGGGAPDGGMGGPGGMAAPGERGGPPGAGANDEAREAMRAILEPAEQLTVTQSDAELTIDEKYARMRRLHPDGKKYKTDNGTAEIRSYWKAGRLVVETKRPRGTTLESWELVPDASRLIVNVRLEGGLGPKLELKRIYDRAPDSEG